MSEDNNITSTEFNNIQERVKQRPLNRKKLLRRTIITASMAVIFGVLACITFLVLEPVFSNILHPEEEPETVEIPTDDVEEILPEDMKFEDEPVAPSIQIIEKTNEIDPVIMYRDQYLDLYDVAKATSKSMVKVMGVSSDVDWLDNSFESKNSTPGLYITDNGKELLILCKSDVINNVEKISVTLSDSTVAEGTIKASDSNTGLSIIAVPLEELSESTKESMVPATLGNSKVYTLVASPVIAIGRPYGGSESVGYGIITSKDNLINMTDQNYELLTTDIYGSSSATGILVNLKGEVLGIIDQSYNSSDTRNLISAIGISEIKKTIERMSNARPRTYLGVTGTDVTEEAHQISGVPMGAYVTGIVMDSPAMNAGIQSGDVIIQMGTAEIGTFGNLTELLSNNVPDTTMEMRLMRQSGEEYREITLEVTLEEMP